MSRKNLVLLGMMGAGKTALGKIVAKKQKLEFIDVDRAIEKKNLMTINEIFKKKGEEFFRKEEEIEVLKSLKKDKCLVALGGGAFMNKNIRENVLNNTVSVWLEVDLKTLSKRISFNNKRPLLKEVDKKKEIKEIYNKRKNIYKLANHKISCGKLDKEAIVNKIIKLYEKY